MGREMRSGAADLGAMQGLEQVEQAELYVLHFESQSAERGSRGHGGDTVGVNQTKVAPFVLKEEALVVGVRRSECGC